MTAKNGHTRVYAGLGNGATADSNLWRADNADQRLTGAGMDFCSGMDLAARSSSMEAETCSDRKWSSR